MNTSDCRQAYVERLVKTLRTGLWLTRGEEILGDGVNESEFRYYDSRLCFSEILLSRSDDHSARYGRLGFGFNRLFVLDSGGSPVIYARHSSSGILKIFGALDRRMSNVSQEILNGPAGRAIPEGDTKNAIIYDLVSASSLLMRLLPFFKRMSNDNTDDFAFFEEAEWRIVAFADHKYPVMPATVVSPKRGRLPILESSWDRSPRILANSSPPPDFYLSFNADDVDLLVFPDDATRTEAWNDPSFKEWHGSRKRPLQILTIDECLRF